MEYLQGFLKREQSTLKYPLNETVILIVYASAQEDILSELQSIICAWAIQTCDNSNISVPNNKLQLQLSHRHRREFHFLPRRYIEGWMDGKIQPPHNPFAWRRLIKSGISPVAPENGFSYKEIVWNVSWMSQHLRQVAADHVNVFLPLVPGSPGSSLQVSFIWCSINCHLDLALPNTVAREDQLPKNWAGFVRSPRSLLLELVEAAQTSLPLRFMRICFSENSLRLKMERKL